MKHADLLPCRRRYWNKVNFKGMKQAFADGGGTDNLAITPLLRRKVGHSSTAGLQDKHNDNTPATPPTLQLLLHICGTAFEEFLPADGTRVHCVARVSQYIVWCVTSYQRCA